MDERATVVAVTWVYDHACGFVDHQQLIVLIDYVERYVLRSDRPVLLRMRQHHCDGLLGLDLVVALDRLAIHPDESRLGGKLYTMARSVWHTIH